jgi:hypothetical protein
MLTICAQQWLGIGYIVLQGENTFLYTNFRMEYACHVSGKIYSCQGAPIEAWQARWESP